MTASGVLPLVAATLLGGALFTSVYGITAARARVRARVRHRLDAGAAPSDRRAAEATPTLTGQPARQKISGRIQANLQRANLTWTTNDYLAVSLITGVVFGVVVLFTTKIVLVAALVGLAGCAVPTIIVRRRAAARGARFNGQVADTIELIASSLRSGFGFMQSLELASREQPEPIAGEFRQVIREVDLGVSVEEALERLVARTHDEDLELVVQAVLVLRRVGGDIGDVLGRIAEMIRDRIRVRGEIHTLTAQMRMSSWIVGILPLALGAVTAIIQPEQMAVLFTEPVGQVLVAVALTLQVIGFMVIRRVSNISY